MFSAWRSLTTTTSETECTVESPIDGLGSAILVYHVTPASVKLGLGLGSGLRFGLAGVKRDYSGSLFHEIRSWEKMWVYRHWGQTTSLHHVWKAKPTFLDSSVRKLWKLPIQSFLTELSKTWVLAFHTWATSQRSMRGQRKFMKFYPRNSWIWTQEIMNFLVWPQL